MVEEDEFRHVAAPTVGCFEERRERVHHDAVQGGHADDDLDQILAGVRRRVRRDENERQALQMLRLLLLHHVRRRRGVRYQRLQGVASEEVRLVGMREEAARGGVLGRRGRVEHVLIELEENEWNGVVEREVLVGLQQRFDEVVRFVHVDLLQGDAVEVIGQLMVVQA